MTQQKKNLGAYIAIFMGSFVAVFVSNVFRDNPEKELKAMVANCNEECPLQVDNLTTLDSMSFKEEPLKVEYYYSLDTTKYYKVNLKDAQSRLEANAIKDLDTNEGKEVLRKYDVMLNYNYSDNKGNKLFDFSIKHNN